MLGGFVGTIVLIVIGISIIINSNYNCFRDITAIPICIFWVVFVNYFLKLIILLAKKINLWNYSDLQLQKDKVQKNVLRIHG